MITEIYEFWFFWSKNGRFVTHICFPKKRPWNPYFYSVFGYALSGPRCQKKGNFQKPQKRKIWLTTEKLIFGIFAVFYLGFFFCFFVCFFVFVFFFGGFKGQVRWPEGPPHLALNPPYFFIFWVFFVFWFLLYKKNLVFPLEKGIFCLFSAFLFLSPLAFFDLPCFSFPVSLFSSFLSLFLLVFVFLLSFGSLFWSLSLFFYLLWFSFMKGTTSKYSIASFFFINILSCLFSCLFMFQVPFSCLCSFLILSYVFVQHQGFWFPNKQLKKKKKHFLVKRGVATKRFVF